MKKNILLVLVFIAIVVCAFLFGNVHHHYDYLVLVNKYTQLPDDWEENVELVSTKNAWDEDIKIEKNAYKAYKKLKKALKEDEKITIELDSVYRSVEEQQKLWDDWSKDPEKGIDYVRQYVAVPGYSEHHTGLAVDICLRKDGELVFENDDMIADKKTFAKIHNIIADYGFILRYPKDRDEITGYAYEPWHLRYVGDKDLARKIMGDNITLEEYLGSIKNIVKNESAAKYQIELAMQNYLNEGLGDKITNSRFNVTKIITPNEAKRDPNLKDYKLGKNDVAFELKYQLQPAEGTDYIELTAVDGEYNEELGWIVDKSGLGILRDNGDGTYKIENFGTGW